MCKQALLVNRVRALSRSCLSTHLHEGVGGESDEGHDNARVDQQRAQLVPAVHLQQQQAVRGSARQWGELVTHVKRATAQTKDRPVEPPSKRRA